MATKTRNAKKLIPSKNYKYVSMCVDYITTATSTISKDIPTALREDVWLAKVGTYHKRFNTERDAALAVDKNLLSKGKKPVNILIKKATE